MGLIGQYQQTSFSNPQNGQDPDADVVRGNDNALVAKHNDHDSDETIHIQTGLLSSRPAAGNAYAVYIDESRKIYVDNGTSWVEVPYIKAGDTVSGNLTITGAFQADTVDATTLTGDHVGDGSGLTNIPQSAVTSLTSDLAGKASTSHTHNASAITSGTLTVNSTGYAKSLNNTVSGDTLDLGQDIILTINGSSSTVRGGTDTGASIGTVETKPTGMSSYNGADKFLKVQFGATIYWIRLEDWS